MFQWAFLYAYAQEHGIDPYVQDVKYFERYADDIKRMYGAGISLGGLGIRNFVSVHVRRGDYVNNPFYIDLTKTDYYQKAMAIFPEEKFLVFSDDIGWCKQQEIFQECQFSEGQNEVDDLNIMASCKNNIMANSSFSWWAAYLNPNPNKIVVAPKPWYADGTERTACPK